MGLSIGIVLLVLGALASASSIIAKQPDATRGSTLLSQYLLSKNADPTKRGEEVRAMLAPNQTMLADAVGSRTISAGTVICHI